MTGVEWCRPGQHEFGEGDGTPYSRCCVRCNAGGCMVCGEGPVVYTDDDGAEKCQACADCECGSCLFGYGEEDCIRMAPLPIV